MRLIDADALDRAFTMLRFNDDKTLKHWGDRQDWCMSGQEVEDLINSAPTIEPERKTGRWEPVPATNGRGGHFCNRCYEYAPSWKTGEERLTNYCPNCGAYMEGEQNE